MANISDFERLSTERYHIGQEIRKIFRQFVKNNEVIEFDPEDEPSVFITNEWDDTGSGQSYSIARLESCSDGSVGIVTDEEYDTFYDGDVDTEVIEFLMREALEATKEDK